MNLFNFLNNATQSHPLATAYKTWQDSLATLASATTATHTERAAQKQVAALSEIFSNTHKRLLEASKSAALDFLQPIKPEQVSTESLQKQFADAYASVVGKGAGATASDMEQLCNVALNLIERQAAGYFDMTKTMLGANMHAIQRHVTGAAR